ncbi:hypothetical protein EYF80_064864 [Liparis tanakae]|uniref:Uncharacterized protein n=1 Tax=Liparis tanakae TaxID=230148 RepID=A0A4Z2E888_9TELE|nr:hypothetical protein EYF80_064864 [Liparis tanakae]
MPMQKARLCSSSRSLSTVSRKAALDSVLVATCVCRLVDTLLFLFCPATGGEGREEKGCQGTRGSRGDLKKDARARVAAALYLRLRLLHLEVRRIGQQVPGQLHGQPARLKYEYEASILRGGVEAGLKSALQRPSWSLRFYEVPAATTLPAHLHAALLLQRLHPREDVGLLLLLVVVGRRPLRPLLRGGARVSSSPAAPSPAAAPLAASAPRLAGSSAEAAAAANSPGAASLPDLAPAAGGLLPAESASSSFSLFWAGVASRSASLSAAPGASVTPGLASNILPPPLLYLRESRSSGLGDGSISGGGGRNSKVLLASAPSARLQPSSRLSSARSGSRELSSLLVLRLAPACLPPPPLPPGPPADAPFPPPCASFIFPPEEEEEPGPFCRDTPPPRRTSIPPPPLAASPFLLVRTVSLGRTAASCWDAWPLPL